MKKKLYITVFSIIIILLCLCISNIAMKKQSRNYYNKDIYSVVFHNNTQEDIGQIKIYISMGENIILYSIETNVLQNEYRKVNINIKDNKLELISASTYNVYVEVFKDDKKVSDGSAGYFTSEYGGLEIVTLNKSGNKFSMNLSNTEADKKYKKIKKRHYKNQQENSWVD